MSAVNFFVKGSTIAAILLILVCQVTRASPRNKTERRMRFLARFKNPKELKDIEYVRQGLQVLRERQQSQQKSRKVVAGMEIPPEVKAFAIKLRAANRNVSNEIPSIPKANEGLEDYLYAGDILLTPQQVDEMLGNSRPKRQAVPNSDYKWPVDDPINYYFDEAFPTEKAILFREAADFWNEYTCLWLLESTETPRIRVYEGTGCSSSAGFVADAYPENEQKISLEPGCGDIFGTMTHELAHALGIKHQQCRSDRNLYIEVDTSLMTKQQDQWNINSDTLNYNSPYEPGSVMHYADAESDNGPIYAWSYDRVLQASMGNRVAPTFLDVWLVNTHYGCMSKCTSGGATCKNGGFRNPNNCNKCICPSGFGGTTCSGLGPAENGASDDGEILQATSSYQTLEGATGSDGDVYHRSQAIHWHIKAPAGKRVEIVVKNWWGLCTPGCKYGSLEIKSKTFTMTGSRYCCDSDIASNPKLISADTMAIVSLYSLKDESSFEIQYRYVNPPPTCVDADPNCKSYKMASCDNPSYSNWAKTQCK
uniref:Zinc metalloproteinase n=1 Tax=Panagrolaimus sp. ES5 TaxID=591445 RepID=A0AC34G6S6_9BILA